MIVADKLYIFVFGNSQCLTSTNALYNDLIQIKKYAFQWKMRFNPDPRKQAQEIIFSTKTFLSFVTF